MEIPEPPEFDPRLLLEPLIGADVDFVVIGGVAMIAHGYVRTTDDLDITYDTVRENLDRLGDVMVELNAQLRGTDDDVPFVADGRALRRTKILTLTTDAGWIDLLATPAGAPRYRELRAEAELVELQGIEFKIASIRHLEAMKRAAGRPIDQTDLDALRTIARLKARRR